MSGPAQRHVTTYLLAMGLLACHEESTRSTSALLKTTSGAANYARYCALCHGEQGEGYAADHANALSNDAFLRLATPEFLRESIARGRPGTPMAAWGREYGGPLDEKALTELVGFLIGKRSGPASPLAPDRITGSLERARPLFAERCASCHGSEGQGDTAISLRNPVFLELVPDEYLRLSILQGRPGTPMAAFEGDLSATQVDDLVSLIRSWQRAPATRVIPSVTDVWAGVSDDGIVLNAGGPAPRFRLHGRWYVAAIDLRDALRNGAAMVLLDARPASDWWQGHLPGALPVPFYADATAFDRLPTDGTWIVVYCGCPHAAADQVATRLTGRGFQNVAVLDEGYFYWEENGFPIVRGTEESGPDAEDTASEDTGSED